MRVHVVGNVCIDTTFRLGRFARPGETLNADGHSDGIGGKGANQAVAAARTGAPVDFLAATGMDAAARTIREMLSDEFDTALMPALQLPTDRSTIMVDASGENIIVSGVTCAEAFDPLLQTGLAASIGDQDIVLLQGNLRADVTIACLKAAKASGATTVFNPSPLAPGSSPDLAAADIVIVNEGEAAEISGHADPLEAARDLISRGAGSVVITLGARGCLVVERAGGAPDWVEGLSADVVDTSGAGDVFCGCIAGCLAQKIPLGHAVRIATAAAALSVGRTGTMQSCPSQQEMAHLIDMEMETENA
ncbi:ribokinase [Rhizobium tumorigenes]|uniref:ribokinase n=1 Tax=Rhizobium tumorigenes TaxID=2041385 RepID=UPI0024203F3F|nr:ribokinase [Rhizobium tumorigenes]WFS04589.1 ribokinase [Rhizobium tumorigenes]